MAGRTIVSGFAKWRPRWRQGIAAAAIATILGAAVPASAQVYIQTAPPPLRREVVPRPPGAGVVWQGGFWRWNGRAWVWVRGHYVRPPRPGVRWIPGHWVRRPRGWFWVAGHWA